MPDALIPSTGWGVLHLFCPLTPSFDAEAVVAATKSAEADGYQAIPFAVLGHKADLGFMALGPDLWRLQQFQAELQRAGLGRRDVLRVAHRGVGVRRGHARGDAQGAAVPEAAARRACGRSAGIRCRSAAARADNWFTLPFDDRKELMLGHGKTGRTFAGRVLQVITGSAGLDDWEWGVSLFAVNPDDLKEVVYKMRFDEASAKYAEFGPFITGLIADVEEVVSRVAR